MKRFALFALLGGFAISGFAQSPSLTGVTAEEVITTGLSYALAVRHAKDGTGRMYVVEKTGRIRIINRDFSISPTLLLDVSTLMPDVSSLGNERGLLGLAFDPDYAVNRIFYVYYIDTSSDTVVSRFVAPSDGSQTPTGSGTIVLRIDQPFPNHNGGDIHFGPDNMLYIGMGDGGSADDPCGSGQTLDITLLNPYANSSCDASAAFTNSGGRANSRGLLGKMLRIDVRNIPAGGVTSITEQCGAPSAGNAQYRIPATGNPFSGSDSICDEVLHYGLRNPYRFSFDRQTGDMLIADVGQGSREEISLAPAGSSGLNFGWRCREGELANTNNTVSGRVDLTAPCRNTDPPLANLAAPIITYGRANSACSVTGGFRFRGPVQDLRGAYFYGDYCNGRITAASPITNVWTSLAPNPWFTAPFQTLSGFGEDEAGWVYFTRMTTANTGGMRRIFSEQMFRDGFGG